MTTRTFTTATVVDLLGDAVKAVHGARDAAFSVAQPLHLAGRNAISFSKIPGEEGLRRIMASQAGVVICGVLPEPPAGRNIIVTDDPRKAFVKVVGSLFTPPRRTGVHPTAVVHPEADIHPSVFLGPYVVVGRCSIGANTEIYAGTTLYDGTRVGQNVTIHAGTVVGADGFGYERNEDGTMEKFVHLGGVLIEDDVEIGSNTSIDRGTLADTTIRRGAKIDNQVHIAHNCDIGEDAVVIAQSMIGGSVKLGARSWVAPGTVIMNGISCGDDSFCGLGSVVTKSVPTGETVMGNPARPLAEAKTLLGLHKKMIAGGDR